MLVRRRRTLLPNNIIMEETEGRKDIKTIHIKGLFEKYNYHIELEQLEKVSIIIAPNGCGKSTIFRLLNLMFNPNISEFLSLSLIPFESISCEFLNGEQLTLTKAESFTQECNDLLNDESNIRRKLNKTDAGDDILKTSIILNKEIITNGNVQTLALFDLSATALKIVDNYLEEYLYCSLDHEVLKTVAYKNKDNSRSSYIDQELINGDVTFRNEIVAKLKEWNLNINLQYIKANRLHRNFNARNNDTQDISALEISSYMMNDYRTKAIQKYNEKLSKAKDMLPQKYIHYKKIRKSDVDKINELTDKWDDYKTKLQKYAEIGLIPDKHDLFVDEEDSIEKIIQNNTQFMSVYIDLFLPTLEPLEDIYQKMSLFKQIFDERNQLTGKTLSYIENGFEIQVNNSNGSTQILPLNFLSSGEKNDFVMFFDLIFQSSNKGLFLVDEPEISLHIEWQETYLDYLCKICKLNDCLAIVATHSPNILNAHESLLRGLNHETA